MIGKFKPTIKSEYNNLNSLNIDNKSEENIKEFNPYIESVSLSKSNYSDLNNRSGFRKTNSKYIFESINN